MQFSETYCMHWTLACTSVDLVEVWFGREKNDLILMTLNVAHFMAREEFNSWV